MPAKLPQKLVDIATAEIGVREVPLNSNRGPRVDEYKASTWLPAKESWPWCAAFICWLVQQALRATKVKETNTFTRPRTAGAWDFINWSLEQDNSTWTVKKPKAADIEPGDILVYTFSHIGLATSKCTAAGNIRTIEGNTDASGSREGGGVYAKTRKLTEVKARIRFRV